MKTIDNTITIRTGFDRVGDLFNAGDLEITLEIWDGVIPESFISELAAEAYGRGEHEALEKLLNHAALEEAFTERLKDGSYEYSGCI